MGSAIESAEERAYREIKQRILDGRLPPGMRLVHRALAAELSMSPIPVVLALRMLQRDGLIVNTPGLGATVRVWTREEIVDSYHIRAFYESLAARLCAQRATAVDIAAIMAARDAIWQSVGALEAEVSIRAELDFHRAIIRGAHCPDLELMSERFSVVQRNIMAFSISLNVSRPAGPEVKDTHDPHDTIVEAIANRDPDAAERAAREHVEEALASDLAWIEEVTATMATGAASCVALRGNRSANLGME